MNSLSKSELRIKLQTNRRTLTPHQIQERSQKIIEQCITLIPWQNVRTIHTYLPIKSKKEIDTWLLLQYVWERYPNIKTAVPFLGADGLYNSVTVSAAEKLQIENGTFRADSTKFLSAETQFDVVIVPMLGYDDGNHRLGYGKGWYDRFLVSQSLSLTIGLCYATCHVPEGLPIESHDVSLKYIVTENETIKNRGHK